MMMLVNRMARRVFESSSRVTKTSIVQITTIERTKIISCANGNRRARARGRRRRTRCRRRECASRAAAARSISDRISSTPMTEMAGTTSPSRNTVSRASKLASQPDSPATARMPNDERKAAEHLNHAELGADLVLRRGHCRRRRRGRRPRSTSRRRRRPGSRCRSRSASRRECRGGRRGRTRSIRRRRRRASASRQAVNGGADQDVGPPLRAEDRNAVDQLAEHHLHGPRQAEPDADAGELRRASASAAP